MRNSLAGKLLSSMGIKRYCFILLFCLCFNSANGQAEKLPVSHISIKPGFSQNTIFCIYQDSRGFMWFGSEEGLQRYDGYRFHAFSHNEFDSLSISDNIIYAIHEDARGDLWIGTHNGGLNRFNRRKETFQHFRHSSQNKRSLSDNRVQAILDDDAGNLWVGTANGGLNRFDRAANQFVHYRHRQDRPEGLSDDNVRFLFQDRNNDIWVATNQGGLHRMKKDWGQFEVFRHNAADPASLSNNTVTSIAEDRNGRLWIGTDQGINCLDIRSSKFLNIANEFPSLATMNNEIITNVLAEYDMPENQLNLWIATLNGLVVFRAETGKIESLSRSIGADGGLKSDNLLSLYKDRAGVIWIGSENGGINKVDRKKQRFAQYTFSENVSATGNNAIRAILPEAGNAGNSLWLGTVADGLIHLNRSNGDVRKFRLDESRSSNNVTALWMTDPGVVWVGTWGGGVNRMVFDFPDGAGIPVLRRQKTFKHDPDNPNSLSHDVVQAIYKPENGEYADCLWIGTDNGLDCFDLKAASFRRFRHNPDDPYTMSDNRIQSNCILQDRQGNLWVGTWHGLNVLPARISPNHTLGIESSFQRFLNDPGIINSLSDNHIIALHEDHDTKRHILWVGTHGGGLNRLEWVGESGGRSHLTNATSVQITRYSEKNGLPDDVIYGIAQDEQGNLWVSTNFGISKFDPATETFSNFDERDGLRNTRFFWGAAAYDAQRGEILFGSDNGLTTFFPNMFTEDHSPPPIFITDFQIFNQSVAISHGETPLRQSIQEAAEITLTHESNIFSFEFAVLDFSNPEKNQYAYKLEGFDKDWIYSGKRHYATYTNLDAGSYQFHVKGSNSDGVWSRNAPPLTVIVLPPFWKTWWFIALVALFFVGTFTYFATARVKQLLAVERLRAKLAADLHDDIGAGLSEISILSEIISSQLEDERKEQKKILAKISEDSRNLVDRMSDIVWLVNPRRDSLYDLILRLKDSYAEVLSLSNISFRSENLKALESISLSMEQRQNLYLIFKEGINNSIKYSHCNEILLNAKIEGKRLEMFLKDNGRGFDSDMTNPGNGLANMTARAAAIGGYLTIDSAPEKGTAIYFKGNLKGR